jgi:hypothetical protein
MNELDALRLSGWSYWAGYSHAFGGFVARAWKPRPKPQRFKAPGGGDVTLVNFCVSASAATLEGAARQCAELAATDPDGLWWSGLPARVR